MGWAFLPPLQRTLDRTSEPVTRPTAFPHELALWRNPSFAAPLTHLVIDTAPSGVIDGDGGGVGLPRPEVQRFTELTLLPPPRPTALQRRLTPTRTPTPGPATRAAMAPSPLTRAPDTGLPVVHRKVVDEPPPEPVTVDEPEEPTPTWCRQRLRRWHRSRPTPRRNRRRSMMPSRRQPWSPCCPRRGR